MIDNLVLIVGAAKSGTTNLFSYLSSHPQIAPCRLKEPGFFTKTDLWAKGFEWCQTLWEFNPKQHKYALEATVGYTDIPNRFNAAERISEIPSNFKFIYILRNPIERIESHFTHGHARGWKAGKSIVGFEKTKT